MRVFTRKQRRQHGCRILTIGNASPVTMSNALVSCYDLIAEICDAMLQLGWQPYQNDHEDGSGQYEINWGYGPAC